MSFRRWLSLLTPPALVLIFVKIRQRIINSEPDWEFIDYSWPKNKLGRQIGGWNKKEVALANKAFWMDMIKAIKAPNAFGESIYRTGQKNNDIKQHNLVMSYAYVLSKVWGKKPTIKILDWGGALGQYYQWAKSLYPKASIKFTCKELPFMCEIAGKINPEIRMVSDMNMIKHEKFDLVMAVGAMHYEQDWKSVLKSLARSSKTWVFVNRLPTVKKTNSYVILQRAYRYGYNTEFLCWCLNEAKLLSAAKKNGLKLERKFVTGEQPIIPNAPEPCVYRGYLFKKI